MINKLDRTDVLALLEQAWLLWIKVSGKTFVGGFGGTKILRVQCAWGARD